MGLHWINDHDDWAVVKIRQHATDPSRTAGRTGFEGSDVVNLNADLSKLLRYAVRGGGPPRDRPPTSNLTPKRSEESPIRGTSAEGLCADPTGVDDDDKCATPSADEEEEWAAAAEAAPDRGPCPTPAGHGIRTRRLVSAATPSRKRNAAEDALEADAFLESILNGDSDPQAKGADGSRQRRHQLDSWENYLDRPVRWIDAGLSPIPTPRVVIQWFSFVPPTCQDSPSSSDVNISSPSHVSNSAESNDIESPPSVPSTVSLGHANSAGRSPRNGSVESGRDTKREGSVVWRFPDGSRRPRNIYSDSDDSPSNDDDSDCGSSAHRA